MTKPALRIGTRASALARWQADWVAAQLNAAGATVEMVLISTQGDVKSGPIGAIGTQGVFTKELQRALLDNEIDLAVHSLKDLPTDDVPGLSLAAVPPRERCGDVLVGNVDTLDELPQGATVGTGSARRRAQLLFARSDLNVIDVRGNVDTRLKKLDDGDYDAIVLAEAGLTRLGFDSRIRCVVPKEIMLPAIGQGALGLECRADDDAARDVVGNLNDEATHASVLAERTLLATLRGGCLAPIGAWGRIEDGELQLDAVVLDHNGTQRLTAGGRSPAREAQQLGVTVARQLLDDGAADLIAQARD